MAPVSNREFLDIQATVECRFTLKRLRDMIITWSQVSLFFPLVFETIERLTCFLTEQNTAILRHFYQVT